MVISVTQIALIVPYPEQIKSNLKLSKLRTLD
jgi:hypothetical protein